MLSAKRPQLRRNTTLTKVTILAKDNDMAHWFPIASPRDVRSLALTIAAVAVGSSFAGGPAIAAASGPFLAHQALYELSLVAARGR